MKLKEDKLLIIIQIISLMGLTLTSFLIQLTENKINDWNIDTISYQNGVIYIKSLAQEVYLQEISLFITQNSYLNGKLLTEKEKENLEEIYMQNYSEYNKRANEGVLNIKTKLENPPKCFYFYCSSVKEILVLIQFICISISFVLLTIISVKLSKKIKR